MAESLYRGTHKTIVPTGAQIIQQLLSEGYIVKDINSWELSLFKNDVIYGVTYLYVDTGCTIALPIMFYRVRCVGHQSLGKQQSE